MERFKKPSSLVMSAPCGVPGLAASKTKTSAGPLLCRWTGCEAYENCTEFGSVEELARHVQTAHVEPLEVRFYVRNGRRVTRGLRLSIMFPSLKTWWCVSGRNARFSTSPASLFNG